MEMPMCFPFFHHGGCIFCIMHHFLKMINNEKLLNFDFEFYTKFHYMDPMIKPHFGDFYQLQIRNLVKFSDFEGIMASKMVGNANLTMNNKLLILPLLINSQINL